MTIEINPAVAADEAEWRPLWNAYCTFYNADVSEDQTALTWSRILDPSHVINCLIARDDAGQVVGFTTFFMHPSTWLNGDDCYLEDLYVSETVRGGGIGHTLIFAVRARAVEAGCERLYWNTNVDNARARGLYDKITGGEDGHVRYRMMLT